MNYPIHPAAEQEAVDAGDWYEQHDLALALEFSRTIGLLIDDIVIHPRRYPEAEDAPENHDCRNVVRVGRFPYRIVYTILGDEAFVVAIAHHHRKPGYWRHRLRQIP